MIGAALSFPLACGAAQTAHASLLTFTGTVASRTEISRDVDPTAFAVGAPVTISFLSSESTPPTNDFFPVEVRIVSGSDFLGFANDYPTAGDGYGPRDIAVRVGFFGAYVSFLNANFSPTDGDFSLDASTTADLPQNVEQSLGPVAVQGQAKFDVLYTDFDVDPFDYSRIDITFALSTLSVQGTIAAVPLPPGVALFGMALASLAAATATWRRPKADARERFRSLVAVPHARREPA